MQIHRLNSNFMKLKEQFDCMKKYQFYSVPFLKKETVGMKENGEHEHVHYHIHNF